ncbi:MAG: alpha/beta hydrolase [Candidatus Helarchaeota archaeon]|nr:alpha/beta hydrolase [Candidatus Helarchaeota archaeon]
MVTLKQAYKGAKKGVLAAILIFLLFIPIICLFQLNFPFNNSSNNGVHEYPSQPLKDPPTNNTLFCIHGYGLNAKMHYTSIYNDPYIQTYYNSVIAIDYYGLEPSTPWAYSLGKGFDLDTPIEEIALAVKDFLLDPNNSALFTENIDVIGYSLGGLVVRYMIIQYYETEIKAANFTFDDVVLIATPNHGTYHFDGINNLYMLIFTMLGVLFCLVLIFSGEKRKMLRLISLLICFVAAIFIGMVLGQLFITVQISEAQRQSKFHQSLDIGDETPYSVDDTPPHNDINWSTFRGDGDGGFFWERLLYFFAFRAEPTDGMINVDSVPLGDGAINYGPYPRNHDEMVRFNTSIAEDKAYFSDLYSVLTGELYPG